MKNKKSLTAIWNSSLEDFTPRKLFDACSSDRPRGSILAWGKFAYATWKSLEGHANPRLPHLVISPAEALPDQRPRFVLGAEHPLPGPGSFYAGRRLFEFFDALDRFESPSLHVYLSGGSSSLAWSPLAGWDAERLHRRLQGFYGKPWSIDRLNRERSKLCALKGGGAARWLKRLAPSVARRTRVQVISDVAPFSPAIVGSGPFWGERIPHRVRADNPAWVAALARHAQASGGSILKTRSADHGSWQTWVKWVLDETRKALHENRSGWLILGGEPSVDLRTAPHGTRGGRQSQIGLALLLELADEIAVGRVSVFCGSTDGVDGQSGSAGTYLSSSVAQSVLHGNPSCLRTLRAQLNRFDSAPALSSLRALTPESPGGVNLQDAVMVRIRA